MITILVFNDVLNTIMKNLKTDQEKCCYNVCSLLY